MMTQKNRSFGNFLDLKVPSWLAAAWNFIKDPDNRTVIAWLGGGIAVVAGAIWAVIKFFAGRKNDEDKSGGANVTHSGQGPASGRHTWIGGNGTDGKQIGEAVVEAQRPLIDWVKELSAENAGLLRQLEAARTAPQTLGSEQALAEAIHYTEKQAEAQPRAAETLALLAAGKVAEAIPLFEAEAMEKKTASRTNAKEAAAAYRHLGAIAGLADPKRALEAYEEAVALDPDDIASLYWGGRYSRRLRRFYQRAKAA
jgi:tetratricopeptide (TPR) repeat protein